MNNNGHNSHYFARNTGNLFQETNSAQGNLMSALLGLSNFQDDIAQSFVTSIIDESLERVENDMVDSVIERSLEESIPKKKENISLDISSQKFAELKETPKEITCLVCLSEFIADDDIITLDCNHIFHKKCISEWVKYKTECPHCRDTIQKTKEKVVKSFNNMINIEADDEEEEEEEDVFGEESICLGWGDDRDEMDEIDEYLENRDRRFN